MARAVVAHRVLLSPDELGVQQPGSSFHFGEHLGVGVLFGQRGKLTAALRASTGW